MYSPGVCAVCVTYHPDSGLAERLAKVLRQVSHLIVVDNGSSPPEVEMLRDIEKAGNVTVILCKQNFGIARALNIGLEYAMSQAYEFALLLDQDTDVDEDLVSVLMGVHQSHPDTDRLAVVGAGYAGDSRRVLSRSVDSRLECDEVETVIQSGSLLRLETFKIIGPFREEFFIDYVDSEYCARARRKGYLSLQTKRPLMFHKIGSPARHRFLWMTKNTLNHSADRLYYQARNGTVMLRESGTYRAGLWSVKALSRALRSCKRVIMFEHHKAAKVFAVLQGWCDGVRGRLGRRK